MKRIILTAFSVLSLVVSKAQVSVAAADTSKKTAAKPAVIQHARMSKLDSIARSYHSGGNSNKNPVAANSTGNNKPSTPGASYSSGNMSIKNIDNGIDFSITGCTGNLQEQTVTLYFTFTNPHKVHQLVSLGFRSYNVKTNALDNESNSFDASLISLANENNNNAYRVLSQQLPTGNSLKGSITFINVLPSVKQLSLVNILAGTCNWTGGGDKKSGIIEVRNVPVNWDAKN